MVGRLGVTKRGQCGIGDRRRFRRQRCVWWGMEGIELCGVGIGMGGLFAGRHDVKYMLSDHVGAKVWTASYQASALWVVIDHGAVPIFAKLLGSPSDDVREQDNHFSPLLLHACSPNTKKLPGTEEDLNDNQNMKDVFRLSILVMGSGRHDRWRDEERDPLFAKIVGGMGRESMVATAW
ncbi:hypothetical protein ACS0TY_021905 [Phlomoides rotata]